MWLTRNFWFEPEHRVERSWFVLGETPSWTTSGLGLLGMGCIKSSWAQFKDEQPHDGGADGRIKCVQPS